MTPRSIRRAAERKRKKLEKKLNRSQEVAGTADDSTIQDAFALRDEPAFLSEAKTQTSFKALKLARKAEKAEQNPERERGASAISPAQLAANRANAQLSTGPASEAGKATSCLNAVKTGLTGRTVLLPSEDAAEYERYTAAYEKEFAPVGQRECDLVQSIADTCWRLKRIPALEFGIYALGRVEFAGSVEEYDEALRSGMIELQTFMTYEKQLRNLQLQEARLSRRREKEIAELRILQQARKEKETEAMAEIGFEFSRPKIRAEKPAQIAPIAPAHPLSPSSDPEKTSRHAA